MRPATSKLPSSTRAQRGAVLVTSLALLLVLTILGIAAMRSSTLEERMASNTTLQMRSFQAAESAISAYIDGLIEEYKKNNMTTLSKVLAGNGSTPSPAPLDDAAIDANTTASYLGYGHGIGHSIGVGTATSIAVHRFELIGKGELKSDGEVLAERTVAAGISVLGPGE